jgi:hypothetical protein
MSQKAELILYIIDIFVIRFVIQKGLLRLYSNGINTL